MNDDTKHNNLVSWITKNGGAIHRNLALYTPQIRSSGDNTDHTKKNNYSHRGIFANNGRISKGEVLIRLPSTLALDGSKLPSNYTTSSTTCHQNSIQLKSTKDDNDDASLKRNASPWLRCMAQLIHAYDNQEKKQHDDEQNYNPYLESLPKEYDSLLNWSANEIKSFLKGTALCTSSTTNSSSSDDYTNAKEDENDRALYERFVKTVIPYLSFLRDNGQILESDSKQLSKRQKVEEESSTDDELEHLYPLFREGCMCISTRAFHMQSTNNDANNKECYQGPYLLPYIDLLNHASQGSTKHVTTLSRDTDGSFIMVAERDIAVDEEICHSYDSGSQSQSTEEQTSLNSAQLLQTFGFVDSDNVSKRLLDYHQQQDSDAGADISLLDNITPVVLTKNDISKACAHLASSSYPNTIRTFMDQSGMIDEGWENWEIPPMSDSRSKLLTLYSEELVIPFGGAISDELISICCIHFLPEKVLNDLVDESKSGAPTTALLLGSEVLDDYFLRKLVLQALLNVLKDKFTTYQVCSTDLLKSGSSEQQDHTRKFLKFIDDVYRSQQQSDNESPCYWGKNVIDDVNVLSKLVTCEGGEDVADLIQKFKCGMVISLEERSCLRELKKKVLDMIVNLDDG